ncbi:MAG: glycosyltransferase family 2 protein [Gammaproteobacteria bacterium]|nr:glycosyltransferase family 2 protein [Gammaproteobacteria bacterium]
MSLARVGVVIPARNEENAIASVLDAIPARYSPTVVVVDNASTDATAAVARSRGAVVLEEERPGYGRVMQRGLRYLEDHPVDIVVFLDGDYSDYPEEMGRLVEPILDGGCDLVLSTRLDPLYDKTALPPHVIYGNKLVVLLINRLFGTAYTDLGPFRAIRRDALQRLRMTDMNYGWTVEMQVKARLHRLRVMEVPMRYRARVGQSKISGTIKGSVLAGSKMIYTALRLRLPATRQGPPD